MTPERWRQVRELFEAALDQPPSDLRRWLVESTSDEGVRGEVASLLDHHQRAGEFLVEPIADRVPDLLDDDGPLQPGGRIGDYVVVREVGRGGMGRVYLARDERLGRDVALKALAPPVTRDPMQRERFRREARAAASLSHPGICTVYALEEAGDDLYIASEYVDGCTLRADIAAGRRPTAGEITRAMREIGEALASAHRKGIVHRDLKPENVMRTADGRWKILDFGVARVERAAASLPLATVPGAMIGTPAYMAPEQLNGETAGPPADVFAFGVLLYEWIAGTHPFAAATPLALVAHVLDTDAAPLATRAPHVPRIAAAVIDRCLQKSPSERFASASEIVSALAVGETRKSSRTLIWWRVHQLALMTLYVVAATLGWEVKEILVPGALSLWLFVALGAAAALSGILRGHLVFTEAMNRPRFDLERRRTARVITAADLLIALMLFVDGLLTAPVRALWAVFILALGLAVALAATVMEPATTAAAFGPEASRRSTHAAR